MSESEKDTAEKPQQAAATERPRLTLTPVENGLKGFYADQFKEGERTLLGEMPAGDNLAALSLVDEIWMQRVINRRLLERVTRADPDELELGTLIDVVKALATGTGRVAQLLRENKAVTSGLAGQLEEAINRTLDELSEEWGVKL